jgi:hypothetical protein
MELQKGTRSDQLEADHRSAYKRQRRGHRKLALVCIALEDRNLSQNPEIRMQSGRIEAANRRSTGEFNRRFLHPQLANFLDDHAEPIQLGNHSTRCLFGNRMPEYSINSCQIVPKIMASQDPSPSTSSRLPDSEAISLAPMIPTAR